MNRLAIVTTHPIQYYAPVFQKIAKHNPATKVFYTWGKSSLEKYDPDFQKTIEWDIPLLEGYDYKFLENSSTKPGTDHFRGISNPNGIEKIKEFNPDAILVYGWAWESHLKILRHFSGRTKVWFRGDSNLLDKAPWHRSAVRSIILRFIYRYIDLAFYVGSENKRYFQQFGLKEEQLRFAPHAIDNDRFSIPRPGEVMQIRESLSIPPEAKLILFAGKFEPKKDPFTLLRAFENMKETDVYLLFTGNGVLEKALKKTASQSSKMDKIRFLDFQNQSMMPALYQACQVFCLPSVGPGETWGLAVNEAMAAGKAVVVSNKVGCAADLVGSDNGCIFESGDVNDLTKKLENVILAIEQGEDPGSVSRKIIEKWSFEKQVSVILDELKKLPCHK